MASDWRKCEWGNIATLEYGKSLRGYQEADGHYRVYGTNGPIGWHDKPLCTHSGVIIGRKGAYRGIHYSPEPFFVIDTAFYLEPKEEMNLRWAYYCLLTYDINGMDSGSAIPSTSREAFYHLPVRVPPTKEQRAIACILGSLDDKIEMNRQMNETLEAMAQAVFKSWFVDFDPVRAKAAGQQPAGLAPHIAELFPDELEESEPRKIPKGWKVRRLGDLMSLDKGLSYKGQFLAAEGTQMVNLGCFLGRGRFSEESIKCYSGEYQRRHVVYPGDLVLANTDITQKREVLGSPALIPVRRGVETMIFTHHVFAARFAQDKAIWKLFVYFLLLQDNFRNRAAGFATGTTVLALPRDAVLDLEFVAPPVEVMLRFEPIARRLVEKQWHSANESRTLAALRDALLPRLLSGQIRVEDSMRFEEEVCL